MHLPELFPAGRRDPFFTVYLRHRIGRHTYSAGNRRKLCRDDQMDLFDLSDSIAKVYFYKVILELLELSE